MLPVRLVLVIALLGLIPNVVTTFAAPTANAVRIVVPFDEGWRFTASDPAAAATPELNDTAWRSVDVPHDWSIAGPFDAQNPTGGAGAFLPSGVAWYRRSFTLPADAQGREVFVEFDGVMQNSEVWLNGQRLGQRPNGYVSLRYELTPRLLADATTANVIAVRTDTAQQPASRWYSGAGIYRHARLVVVNPIHLEFDRTFVSIESLLPAPQVAGSAPEHPVTKANVRVRTTVVNNSSNAATMSVRITLLAPDGRSVGSTTLPVPSLAANAKTELSTVIGVPAPLLWDVDTPRLYRAVATVEADGRPVDDESVAFGIRTAEFDSTQGFLLNGRPLKLYGVCLHHDGGAFGAAVPIAVWRQRLETLRSLGVNAIRTAHNPADPAFLDLCDQLGFLVMDELFDCWTVAKNRYDYHLFFREWAKTDVRDTVRRDRNHPSVVLYSAGNEIHDTREPELAQEILGGLVAEFHANDPTRPVTQALFRPNRTHDYANGLADLLDVIGTNYRDKELLAAWRAKPGRRIIGTEQRHDLETWLALRDHVEEAGQFLWTGVDYLGESRRWPDIGISTGLLDRTGSIKPIGRQRQSWWTQKPMVALTRRTGADMVTTYDPGYEPVNTPTRHQVLFADWTPTNTQPHPETVEAYSNCETVELFLNGRSLGAKHRPDNDAPRVWKIPFESGSLVAIARNGTAEVARDELKTAGTPARIALTPDRHQVSSAWDDVVRVCVAVVDAEGTVVPAANNLITFQTEGSGAVVAVDNGNLSSHEAFAGPRREAYQGRCVAFVRATPGTAPIKLHATAPGLTASTVTLDVTPAR